jgi:glycosyltransferase involved in cell wall biosynthesis
MNPIDDPVNPLHQSPIGFSLSVVIPTIDETKSLEQTISFLLQCASPVLEILIVVAPHTISETLTLCESICARYSNRVRILSQKMPYLGGAFRAGISVAKGSHILLMFADLESDPQLVPVMAEIAKREPKTIVSASRWIKGASFKGYGPFKLILNLLFQKGCAAFFRSNVTDFTYGFRLYPSEVLQTAAWRETRHAFVLESILEPLLWKVPVHEVPAHWVARREGVKHSRLTAYCRYVITFIRIISRSRPVEHADLSVLQRHVTAHPAVIKT